MSFMLVFYSGLATSQLDIRVVPEVRRAHGTRIAKHYSNMLYQYIEAFSDIRIQHADDARPAAQGAARSGLRKQLDPPRAVAADSAHITR